MEMKDKAIGTDTAQKKKEEEKDKKRRLLLLLLLLLFLITIVAVSRFLLFRGGEDKSSAVANRIIPPRTEANAEPDGSDGNGKKLTAPEGGGAVSLNYSKEVDIDLSEKRASLMFGNPSGSNQEAVLRLVIGDSVILQSGSLAPGNKVTALDLAEGAAEKLATGVYDGKFVVSFYDRATDRWATLNAEIPVTVAVTE